MEPFPKPISRRHVLAVLSSVGFASTLLPGALTAASQGKGAITTEMMKQAEGVAGLAIPDQAREEIIDRLNRNQAIYRTLRNLEMNPQTPCCLYFNPIPPGKALSPQKRYFNPSHPLEKTPERIEDVAFYPITRLSALLKAREISSSQLTRMYLSRLKTYNPILNCVVTLTEDLAMRQAERADKEIADGCYRGPLHGIPWGVKDLFATKGIPTTWGLKRYRNRVIDRDATVVKRLEDAGAVLVAKLSLGELATGDRWYGGRTRNPWDPRRGSGGSSAGSASAVAAGLVGFSIGTETNGSLIAPAMMCGASGLRPTFGRVSRCGAMPVSWSHDKVGPICRSAEDCAIVLRAICGPDPMDRTVIDLPFDWNPDSDLTGLRVGVSRSLFDMSTEDKRLSLILAAHRKAVETIDAMGVGIAEIEDGPDDPMTALVEASSLGMMVESAAAHEDLYFENETGGDVFSHSNWPDRFRAARTVPAVAYVQANRARTLLMEEVGRRMEGIDVLIGRLSLSPLLSNITGHPELVIPHGLDGDGLPIGIVLTGNLFCESAAIRLAHAYQTATGYHLARPGLTR